MAAFAPSPALFAPRTAAGRSSLPLAARPAAPAVAPPRRREAATPRCTAASPSSPPPPAAEANDATPLKRFLNATPALGRLRLITSNRDACVMEAIATTDSLFYAVGGPAKAEYANIIDPSINLDLHLKLSGWDKVASDVSEERVAAWMALKEEYCGQGNDTVRFV
ncbi:hypothetical protein I4F81_001068 [Pyropia yezoensis]|uniref:Uncharacterized protein n=1 Tax=Pyropia yezoensis TaxID=2788 RepID=A0ACC3BLU4_PYRYE|nr:hypothetical protein I4F81_001068 [Neopyropia yezoensis]